ncbi:hypothetical protein J2810_004450 [Chryseobacterium rhizosphaerae]|jgi:hypothetical protein|uniref:hypothetical protein n=1 Tax=Chryseobacterium rhizosphaerae TaxID=395937 RepID=UPI00285F3CD1|nr:hypothetical protein [Chryseobacterium rhizosphaerae]MDR6548360.1 hypothetical protein [Chryseobacterium rhizosphaerae]
MNKNYSDTYLFTIVDRMPAQHNRSAYLCLSQHEHTSQNMCFEFSMCTMMMS